MKIFVFSTNKSSLSEDYISEFIKSLKELPSDTIIRTSGSKGVEMELLDLNKSLEIFIPWLNFNGFHPKDSSEVKSIQCPAVTTMAVKILSETVIGELKQEYVKIDNRLVYGILGNELKDPVDLVIINNVDSLILPTTSSALVERISDMYGIPTLNLDLVPKDKLNSKIKNILCP